MNPLFENDLQDRIGPFKGLTYEEIDALVKDLKDWKLKDYRLLQKTVIFEHYADGLKFTNWLAQLAETLNHHPDIHLKYKQVGISIHTHNIGGLSLADFVLANHISNYCVTKGQHHASYNRSH